MRSLTHIALTAWFLLAMSTSLAAQDRIPWITDLQVARQMAEQQQRLVLLHFYSDSCSPCQRLERYVFNQPALIRSLTTGYIPVKINAEQAPQLADFYKVKSWPMDIVVDPTGKEVYRTVSPQDANRYIAMLDNVKAHHAIGVAPTDAFSSQPAASSQLGAGGNSSLALDYSPWQTPSQPATGTTPGMPDVQLPQASVAPQPSFQARDQGRQPAGSPWNAPRGAQNNASQNGIPTWQQSAAPADQNWQANAGPANPAPGLDPNNRIASRAAPQFQAPTGTHPPVALDGYCAVSLAAETTWTKGDPRWGAVHRGRTYLFSSPEQQQQFLANPDAMSPILSGFDPVRFVQTGQLVDGKRQHGVFYRDRICLFADEAALHQFSQQPDQYIAAALQAMQQARN